MSNLPSPEQIHERPRVTSEIPPDGPMAGLDRDMYIQPAEYLTALTVLLENGLPEVEESYIKLLPRSQAPADRLQWLFAARQDLAVDFDPETESAFNTNPDVQETLGNIKQHLSESEKRKYAAELRVRRVAIYVGRVSAWQARPKKLPSAS